MKNFKKIKPENSSFLAFAILILSTATIFSQSRGELPSEIPDDPYVEVKRADMPKGPAYNYKNGTGFFTKQVNIDSNGDNIIGDAGNEPSIAVDPTNPNRIVIGWRQFDIITNNFRQAGYGYTVDAGNNWTFPGPINPGNFRSDPVLDFDTAGNFYYNSLRSGFFCDVFSITDGGTAWSAPAAARGGDKQWMRIDRSGGVGDGNNYSYWNSSFTTCTPGSFTRSTDGSNTFESCVVIDGDPRWGTLAVAADGTLYMSGVSNTNGDMIVVKSTTAQNPAITPVAWDGVATVDLDGTLTTGVPLNPSGLWGQCWIDVDVSGGAGHGNVYVCASVPRNSNGDPADVMFAKSTNGGITFSAPIRINKDATTQAYQWFGTMSVAPNGRIDVVWLDTRNAPVGSVDSELYFSHSEDQGQTWSDDERLSLPFDPSVGYPNQEKMGDYFDMVSDNNGAHLAWTNTLNGGQDVYYSFIPPDAFLGLNDNALGANLNLLVAPNPFSEITSIEFSVNTEAHISVTIFDVLGRKVNTLLTETVVGKQQLTWNGTNDSGTKLTSGLYFVTIQAGGSTTTVKVVLEN